MDINQLKQFISVAQTMSFSEAARRNGVSQPAISHSIGDLERQLGALLFVRTKRSVAITDAGKELLPMAVEMVDMAEQAAFRIRRAESGDSGRISINAMITSSLVLSKCISVFSRAYPNITIDIMFNRGGRQFVALSEEEQDVHFTVQEMVPTGNIFDSIISHTDHLCVAFPSDHPLAREELDFSKLAGERFIVGSESDGPHLYEKIMNVCTARGYEPNIVCKYDRAEAVLLSVGAGMGISIIPEALGKIFYSENVVFKRIPEQDAVRTYVVTWRSIITNPAVRLFVDVVKGLFAPVRKA